MDTVTATIIVLVTVTASLGFLQVVFWLGDTKRIDRLAFFTATLGSSVFAFYEIGMAHAETPEQFFDIFRSAQVIGLVHITGIAWFVYTSLKTGRRWLFWTFIGLRLLIFVLNFILPYGTNWKEVSALGSTTIFGEVLHFPVGVASPLALLPIAGNVIVLIFSLDASFRAWRPGDRIRVAIHGFGVALWAIAILGIVFGVVFGLYRGPIFVGQAFLFLNVAIGIQMLLDMQRVAGLSGQLTESEAKLTDTLEQLHLSADAGEVGLWRRNFNEGHFWTSEKANELFGFRADAVISLRDFMERIHQEDVVRVALAMKGINYSGAEFEIEFRIRRPGGEVRWLHSRGDVIGTEPMAVRGATVDITERKAAEQEAHVLARKLINAQEKERDRLARDLHDHLGQSITLVSLRLGELKDHTNDPVHLESRIGQLSEQLQALGSDVHRISHELHPAKLTQLGLIAALRGFCREIAEAHGITVDFPEDNKLQSLGDDLSLCFYRVAQEALQNIVKHAEASRADVRVSVEGNELVMTISDNGKGFKAGSISEMGSLGLISIRERMRAVAGTSKVHSTPGKGTTIEARAPLADRESVTGE